jgi:hypothetical protein
MVDPEPHRRHVRARLSVESGRGAGSGSAGGGGARGEARPAQPHDAGRARGRPPQPR